MLKKIRTQDVDFSKAHTTLKLFQAGPMTAGNAEISAGTYGAEFEMEGDLSSLFPYINAVAKGAQFYDKPVFIKFFLDDHLCAFYPDKGAFAPASDLAEAVAFLDRLIDYVLDIDFRKGDIRPNLRKYKPISAVDIFKLLPGSNCKYCGYATCLAYAAALSRQQASLINCPHLARPAEAKAVFPVYDQEGNCVQTVSLDIDTDCLRRNLDHKETYIRTLKSQLADFERSRAIYFEEANAQLPSPLTTREIQVLEMVANGDTNREISHALEISAHTVKSHVIHIFNKLGVNDRIQASVWAASHGLL